MKTIPLTHEYETIVSDDWYDELSQNKWFAKVGGNGGPPYAARSVRLGKNKYQTIRMHRLITNCPEGMEVDHINGDTLDNRTENLQVVTKKTNLGRRFSRPWEDKDLTEQ